MGYIHTVPFIHHHSQQPIFGVGSGEHRWQAGRQDGLHSEGDYHSALRGEFQHAVTRMSLEFSMLSEVNQPLSSHVIPLLHGTQGSEFTDVRLQDSKEKMGEWDCGYWVSAYGDGDAYTV
jgi:hypothetical protein